MNIRFVIIFILIFNSLNSQSFPVTLKVVDLDSSTSIQGAVVFIDELHFEDTETDEFGIAYFENVPQGKIGLNIRKQGYIPIKETFNVTNDKKNNSIYIRLKKLENEPQTKKPNDSFSFDHSPGTIIIGGNNSGVIQGDNSFFDNSKTFVNPKVEVPKPKIKLYSVDSLNVLTYNNPRANRRANRRANSRAKEKVDSLANLPGPFYKTLVVFKYYSEIQRSNIDFQFLLKSTFHVDVRYVEGIYEYSSFEHLGKILGRRIFSPQNGTYEFTIYTLTPISSIFNSLQIRMNDINAEIEK